MRGPHEYGLRWSVWCAVVGYVVAAWASDLDVANGILPGYIMGLYFFTGYALRLQVRRRPRSWHTHNLPIQMNACS